MEPQYQAFFTPSSATATTTWEEMTTMMEPLDWRQQQELEQEEEHFNNDNGFDFFPPPPPPMTPVTTTTTTAQQAPTHTASNNNNNNTKSKKDKKKEDPDRPKRVSTTKILVACPSRSMHSFFDSFSPALRTISSFKANENSCSKHCPSEPRANPKRVTARLVLPTWLVPFRPSGVKLMTRVAKSTMHWPLTTRFVTKRKWKPTSKSKSWQLQLLQPPRQQHRLPSCVPRGNRWNQRTWRPWIVTFHD